MGPNSFPKTAPQCHSTYSLTQSYSEPQNGKYDSHWSLDGALPDNPIAVAKRPTLTIIFERNKQLISSLKTLLANSCGLSVLAFELTWGWGWPCFLSVTKHEANMAGYYGLMDQAEVE